VRRVDSGNPVIDHVAGDGSNATFHQIRLVVMRGNVGASGPLAVSGAVDREYGETRLDKPSGDGLLPRRGLVTAAAMRK
jgi:hypothetical protein